MTDEAPRVLLVDDDGESTLTLTRSLRGIGFEAKFEAAGTLHQALEVAKIFNPEAAVIDLSLNPEEGVKSGFAVLAALLAHAPFCRVIVLTGHSSSEFGVEALNRGAAHFLEKPADPVHLAALLRDCVNHSRLRRNYEELRAQEARDPSVGLIGESEKMKRLKDQVRYAASNPLPVFLSGETGVGKGLCARAIHSYSSRQNARFVRYQTNFGSADLVNSDLCGHLKGAYTGALQDRRGLFAEADGGTLFLDEVDELPHETQVLLLGALQEKKFRQLGSDKEEGSDFRLLSASNRPMEEAMAAGKFRRDLFHRIAHITIVVPPLREREGDIGSLARHVLKNLQTKYQLNVFEIERAALDRLAAYSWPGNVRQLEGVVEAAAFQAQFHGRTTIFSDDLGIASAQPGSADSDRGFRRQVREFQLKLIKEALTRHQGNQARAAEDLLLDRSTLRRILSREGEL